MINAMGKKRIKFDQNDIIQNGLLVAIIFPVIANGFIVGLELFLIGEPLWMSILTVALGELGVMVLGYILFTILKRNNMFLGAIRANQNKDFKF